MNINISNKIYFFARYIVLAVILVFITLYALYILGCVHADNYSKVPLFTILIFYLSFRWYQVVILKTVIINNDEIKISGLFMKTHEYSINTFKEVKKEGIRPIFYKIYFTDGSDFLFVPSQKYLAQSGWSVFTLGKSKEEYNTIANTLNDLINSIKTNKHSSTENE